MEALHHFFHSSENSCRKIKFTGVFPPRSYTLHLSPFVNNWYKWTPVKPHTSTLSLLLLQLYFYGKNQRSKWKESFSLFKRKKKSNPQLISEAPNSTERTREAWKVIVRFSVLFLTNTAVSSIPTNIHILKGSLVDTLQNTSTMVYMTFYASVVLVRTALDLSRDVFNLLN